MPVQPEGWYWVTDTIVLWMDIEEKKDMEQAGTEGTAFKDTTYNKSIVKKDRGGGILGAVVIVLAKATVSEIQSGSKSALNVKEKGHLRMKSKMQTAAADAAAAIVMMRQSDVLEPVAI